MASVQQTFLVTCLCIVQHARKYYYYALSLYIAVVFCVGIGKLHADKYDYHAVCKQLSYLLADNSISYLLADNSVNLHVEPCLFFPL